MVCLKDHVDRTHLRFYGFKTGRQLAEEGVPNFTGEGYRWKHDIYYKLVTDEETGEYRFTDFEVPIGELYVTSDGEINLDLCPYGTYHIDNWDFQELLDTIGTMFQDGLLEVVAE